MGKFPPPYSLPMNKTVTSLSTWSSPGGGGQTSIRFDDAAGQQVIAIAAAHAKTTAVANNMLTQTVKNENLTIKGTQSRSVGTDEDVSVTQAYKIMAGSQVSSVDGAQKIYVKGKMSAGVGSETVMIGGGAPGEGG